MNRTFMNGYYQGIVEVAPAALSAAHVEGISGDHDDSAPPSRWGADQHNSRLLN
jgi:hypothetical protein